MSKGKLQYGKPCNLTDFFCLPLPTSHLFVWFAIQNTSFWSGSVPRGQDTSGNESDLVHFLVPFAWVGEVFYYLGFSWDYLFFAYPERYESLGKTVAPVNLETPGFPEPLSGRCLFSLEIFRKVRRRRMVWICGGGNMSRFLFWCFKKSCMWTKNNIFFAQKAKATKNHLRMSLVFFL